MINDHFPQKFQDGVIEHMNDDHRDAMVDILHAYCDADWVTDAEMGPFDKEAMELIGLGPNEKRVAFTVPYDKPIDKPQQFRPLLIEMLKVARIKLKL
ncbi:MAG: DUF2470 domain-containing protein [Bacteroidota bacterium]